MVNISVLIDLVGYLTFFLISKLNISINFFKIMTLFIFWEFLFQKKLYSCTSSKIQTCAQITHLILYLLELLYSVDDYL